MRVRWRRLVHRALVVRPAAQRTTGGEHAAVAGTTRRRKRNRRSRDSNTGNERRRLGAYNAAYGKPASRWRMDGDTPELE